MSEMLGNQLFLLHKYQESIPHLEAAIRQFPDHPGPRRKLTFAYAYIGDAERSLDLLEGLIQEDPRGVLGSFHDICHDPQNPKHENDEYRELLCSALISLFCEPDAAVTRFQRVYTMQKNQRIRHILTWLESL